jgi:hypothetical protein
MKGDLFGGDEDGRIEHKQRDGSLKVRDATTMYEGVPAHRLYGLHHISGVFLLS